MKVHWFSVLSAAGLLLLSGSVFGSGLQWVTPGGSAPIAPSAAHIPTVVAADEVVSPQPVLRTQYVEPFQPPFQPLPQTPQVVLPPGTTDQSYNPPPGAVIETVPMTPGAVTVLQSNVPARTRGELVPCDDQIIFKSIREISHDIRPAHTGEMPKECYIESKPFHGRHFSQSCFQWKASALATKGAYFEDTQLDRYGHTKVGPVLQPFVSGAKFFGDVVILPYRMGVHPPNECVYTLGHYRSGSCAPYMIEPFPLSARGALFQAGAVAGVLLAVP